VLVLLAGSNDLAGRGGPMSIEDTVLNISLMSALARARGVRTVVASVLPVHRDGAAARASPRLTPERISELNRRLAEQCAVSGDVWLDYASALADDHGLLRRELSDDGVHPNDAGYAVMARLAESAIRSAAAGEGRPGGTAASRPDPPLPRRRAPRRASAPGHPRRAARLRR
jgi:lysophospholipase L1-like esterase